MRSTNYRKLIKNRKRKRKISKVGKRKLSKKIRGGKRKLSKRIRGGSQQNYSKSNFYRLMTALDNINIEKAKLSYKYLKDAEQVIKDASGFFTNLTRVTGVSRNTGSSIVYPEPDARLNFSTLLDTKEKHIKKLLSNL